MDSDHVMCLRHDPVLSRYACDEILDGNHEPFADGRDAAWALHNAALVFEEWMFSSAITFSDNDAGIPMLADSVCIYEDRNFGCYFPSNLSLKQVLLPRTFSKSRPNIGHKLVLTIGHSVFFNVHHLPSSTIAPVVLFPALPSDDIIQIDTTDPTAAAYIAPITEWALVTFSKFLDDITDMVSNLKIDLNNRSLVVSFQCLGGTGRPGVTFWPTEITIVFYQDKSLVKTMRPTGCDAFAPRAKMCGTPCFDVMDEGV